MWFRGKTWESPNSTFTQWNFSVLFRRFGVTFTTTYTPVVILGGLVLPLIIIVAGHVLSGAKNVYVLIDQRIMCLP